MFPLHRIPVGLREDEPAGPPDEEDACLPVRRTQTGFLGCHAVLVDRSIGNRHRHAEDEGPLPSPHLASFGLPSGIRGDRPEPDPPRPALAQRRELVTHSESMKGRVGLQHETRGTDRFM